MPNFRALSLSLVALVAIAACNEKKAETPAPASTEQQPVHAATPVAARRGRAPRPPPLPTRTSSPCS